MSKAKTTKAKAVTAAVAAAKMEIEFGDKVALPADIARELGKSHTDVFRGRAEADYVQLQNEKTTIRVCFVGNTLEIQTFDMLNINIVNPATAAK